MESIGIPNGWEGVGIASLFLLSLFYIISGRVYFKWQVDKMFKDKDDLIALQAKTIEAHKELIPVVVKILEQAHQYAELAKVRPTESNRNE